MSHEGTLTVLVVAGLVLLGGVGTVAAHDWQTTVTQGPMELGISSTPEAPKAGMQTEFSARIVDSEYESDANRTSWGGVVNTAVEVHIRGPDGYHDHVQTHVPEDGAHFHFAYVFPEAGNYSIAIVTQLEGQEYAFQFQKQVTLLPTRSGGEELEHLSTDVHAVNESVDRVESDVQTTNQNVEDLNKDVEELNQKVDSLESQIERLQTSLDEHETAQADAGHPDIGLYAVMLLVGAAVGGVAVVGTRRL